MRFAADGATSLTFDELPCARSTLGDEFDDYRIWVGNDPRERRALSVSARNVRDASGSCDGAALAYSDITDLMRTAQEREVFLAGICHELRTPSSVVVVTGRVGAAAADVQLDPVLAQEYAEFGAEATCAFAVHHVASRSQAPSRAARTSSMRRASMP